MKRRIARGGGRTFSKSGQIKKKNKELESDVINK